MGSEPVNIRQLILQIVIVYVLDYVNDLNCLVSDDERCLLLHLSLSQGMCVRACVRVCMLVCVCD